MNPQTRKLLVQRLIPAIGVIGPDFERFAGLVLDHVLSTRLEHTGLNALGFPISRVLDSASADGAIVAEYSAETDYFRDKMPKAEKDLAHAFAHRPTAKLVILMAAQPGRPQIVEAFVKAAMAKPVMYGRSLRIWGAERIAELLIDNITFNDAAVEALSAYLPLLSEIWEEAARDRLFPTPDPRHRPRPAVSDEISRVAAPTAVIWEGRVFQRYVSEGAELGDGDVYRDCFAVRAVRQMDAGPEQRS